MAGCVALRCDVLCCVTSHDVCPNVNAFVCFVVPAPPFSLSVFPHFVTWLRSFLPPARPRQPRPSHCAPKRDARKEASRRKRNSIETKLRKLPASVKVVRKKLAECNAKVLVLRHADTKSGWKPTWWNARPTVSASVALWLSQRDSDNPSVWAREGDSFPIWARMS